VHEDIQPGPAHATGAGTLIDTCSTVPIHSICRLCLLSGFELVTPTPQVRVSLSAIACPGEAGLHVAHGHMFWMTVVQVLQCGHTVCKSCLQQMGQPIRCLYDRSVDERAVSGLPTNHTLVDALRLDLVTAYKGLMPSSSSSGSSAQVARLWLDDTALQLSSTVLGHGATGHVVEGSYEGRPVSVQLHHASTLQHSLPETSSLWSSLEGLDVDRKS